MPSIFKYVRSFLGIAKQLPNFYQIVLVMIAGGFLSIVGLFLLMPVLDMLLFDITEVPKNRMVYIVLSLFDLELDLGNLIFLSLSVLILSFLMIAYGQYLSYKSRFYKIRDIRQELIKHYSDLDWKYFKDRHSGKFNDLIINQAKQAGAGYYVIYTFWTAILQAISYLILGLWLSYELMLVVLLLFLAPILIAMLLHFRVRKYSKKYTNEFQELGYLVADYANNPKSFRVSKNLEYIIVKIVESANLIALDLRSMFRLNSVQTFVLQVFGVGLIFFVVYVREDFGLVDSSILVFLASLKKFTGHAHEVFNNALTFQNYSASIDLVEKEICALKMHKETTGGYQIDGINSIELNNVKFGYSDNRDVVAGASLYIEEGDTLVFTGESGCGKSTLFDLILLLYSQDSGKIYVNGVDSSLIEKKSYRSRIAYVGQNPILNYGTVLKNLAVDDNVSKDKLVDICKSVDILDWILSDNGGWNKKVGEKGGNLSGGQLQRFALAKALLQDPDVLILDEPTSALDKKNEQIIAELIRKMKNRMIVLIITHNPSLFDFADGYVLFQSGKTSRFDSYKEFINYNEE